MIRLLIFSICFQLAAFSSLAANSDPQKSPRFLVHLLDYLAKDYAGAVGENHKVLSQSEYNEQAEFAETALKTNQGLDETKSDATLATKLNQLHEMILKKESPAKVTALARELQQQVIQVAKLDIVPTQWPSLKEGEALYAQNCTACHGAAGKGDGPAGKSLDPQPANFTDAERMGEVSPFAAFNTIRLGVPGTGMPSFSQLSDHETWALSFYIMSLDHKGEVRDLPASWSTSDPETLQRVSSLSDKTLLEELPGTAEQKQAALTALRRYAGSAEQINYLSIARTKLLEAGDHYKAGEPDLAKSKALQAYLEGVEPVEAKISASDPEAKAAIEDKMAAVRSAIEKKQELPVVQASIQQALLQVEEAAKLIEHKEMAPIVAFFGAFGILVREGFEAVLIILALLSVIRAAGTRKAALYVHGGWLSALGVGLVAWFFAGWLMQMSGASREVMEGMTSLFAVAVLLYVGFWLHRQTEIGRWKHFLEVRVKGFLEGKKLWGLAAISFVAVFREAFEVVLFLRAIWLDLGPSAKLALAAGVGSALALVIAISWIALNYSKRLPVKKLFTFSSVMMLILSTILAGKGVHSLQEAGWLGVSALPWSGRMELFGIFPTMESLLAQIVTFVFVLALWFYGRKPATVTSIKAA